MNLPKIAVQHSAQRKTPNVAELSVHPRPAGREKSSTNAAEDGEHILPTVHMSIDSPGLQTRRPGFVGRSLTSSKLISTREGYRR